LTGIGSLFFFPSFPPFWADRLLKREGTHEKKNAYVSERKKVKGKEKKTLAKSPFLL
jgi:hypothetical protein